MAESHAKTKDWLIGKHYATKGAMKHHANHYDDFFFNEVSYGWIGSYNQRGLCVRIICPLGKEKKLKEHIIERVKFITHQDETISGPGLPWKPDIELTFDAFLNNVQDVLKGFELHELSGIFWDGINDVIQQIDLRYELVDDIRQWLTMCEPRKEKFKSMLKLPSSQEPYLTAFHLALKTDFTNGHAKRWMMELIKNILRSEDLPPECVIFDHPSNNDGSNSYLEVIKGRFGTDETNLDFDAPLSCPSVCSGKSLSETFESLSISRSPEGHQVVPDFFIALPEFPGVFPLVVELKPSLQREDASQFQNIKQMLTKMFYQDVIFGFVISPLGYKISVITKEEGTLNYNSTHVQNFYSTVKKNHLFDLKSFNKMISFITGIVRWSLKTKCALSKSNNE